MLKSQTASNESMLHEAMSWVVDMKEAAKTMDIAELQVQYGATHKRIFKVTFVEMPVPLYFQVDNGKFQVFLRKKKQDNEIQLKLSTYLNIMRGQGKRRNPENGEIDWFPYSFYHAWRWNHIQGKGERVTNACRSFLPIFDALIEKVRAVRATKEEARIEEESTDG